MPELVKAEDDDDVKGKFGEDMCNASGIKLNWLHAMVDS